MKSFLNKFSNLKILVIGDVMLDRYLLGKVSRISPEAPVPIVNVEKESFFLGGSANVARNLRALGANVSIVGAVGKDVFGSKVLEMLKSQGIENEGMIKHNDQPTTLKTRIIAQNQQMIRFDIEKYAPMTSPMFHKSLSYVKNVISEVDAIIFEDYHKGFIEQEFLNECVALAHKNNVLTFADPKINHNLIYKNLTAITPNRGEAFWMTKELPKEPNSNPLEDTTLLKVGEKIIRENNIENVLITLSELGMCLFRYGERPRHVHTVAQEVFDVSGAGDTAISVFALGLCSGMDEVKAMELSNLASGIVVGKMGTATVSKEEILRFLK